MTLTLHSVCVLIIAAQLQRLRRSPTLHPHPCNAAEEGAVAQVTPAPLPLDLPHGLPSFPAVQPPVAPLKSPQVRTTWRLLYVALSLLQLGYLQSWSAYQTYRQQHPAAPDPLLTTKQELLEALQTVRNSNTSSTHTCDGCGLASHTCLFCCAYNLHCISTAQ